jgi:hypothetical protein
MRLRDHRVKLLRIAAARAPRNFFARKNFCYFFCAMISAAR